MVVAIIALVLVIVVLVIIAVVGTFLIASNPNTVTIDPPDPACSAVDITSLPSIVGLPCCKNSAQKYVNNLDGVVYDLVTGPSAVNWFTVCRGFCIQGWDTNSNTCIGQQGQPDFDRCQMQIEPVDCQGVAKPLFNQNNRLYYANSAGAALCPIQEPCGS